MKIQYIRKLTASYMVLAQCEDCLLYTSDAADD